MNSEFDNAMDALWKLDSPQAQKYRELHKAAFSTDNTDTASEYLANWIKNNPEQAKEMREFMDAFEKEYTESRREVKSELGYSRIGLGNV